MNVAEMFLNAENMRTLLLLIAMFSGFIWLKYSFHIEMDRKMDEKFDKFYQMLKANDFAHLNKTIAALTYTLQKNGLLKKEDKEFVDGMLEN